MSTAAGNSRWRRQKRSFLLMARTFRRCHRGACSYHLSLNSKIDYISYNYFKINIKIKIRVHTAGGG